MTVIADVAKPSVVIVGAGVSGLACAKTLLEEGNGCLDIKLLEASDCIGGRIKADKSFIPGHVVDLGAEFVHGQETLLTDWIQQFGRDDEMGIGAADERDGGSLARRLNWGDQEAWEEVFTLAHSDGGGRPDSEPTRDGKYGMYYVGGKLVMYNDPRLEELNEALEGMLERTKPDCTRTMSVADAIEEDRERQKRDSLSEDMEKLAVASFGNTAGSSDLRRISINTLIAFEQHWEEAELEGDHRLPGAVGMQIVIEECSRRVLGDDHVTCHLEWPVASITENNQQVSKSLPAHMSCRGHFTIGSSANENDAISADAVVLTVPPPQWNRIKMDIPKEKRDAMKLVGFNRAMKIVTRFSHRLWPEKLQSVISADEPVPEIWFRDVVIRDPPTWPTTAKTFLATGFLVSDAADEMAKAFKSVPMDGACEQRRRKQRETIAADIQIRQLAKVLNVPEDVMRSHHVSTLVHDWVEDSPYIGGGYMFPKTGMMPDHLKTLAAPLNDRLFFAGEATNTNACCTVQAAIETGVRAARQILSSPLMAQGTAQSLR